MSRHQHAAPRRRPGRLRRALRGRGGRVAALTVLGVLVLVAGLLLSGYLNAPAPALGTTAPPSPGLALPSARVPASSAPASGAASGAAGAQRTQVEVLNKLRQQFPDNPLNHLDGAGLHDVVVTISSHHPLGTIGFLVPTGLSTPYGTPKISSSSWSLRQQAVGPGNLAALFVQSDAAGDPVTCTVRVDGKVTDRRTTSGQYGRAVCLG